MSLQEEIALLSGKSKTLDSVFKKTKESDTAKKQAQEDARLDYLKEMLWKTPIGKETLEFLDEKGSDVGFEEGIDAYGFFDPEANRVALNPAFSDEDLAITFVHEMRHARQDSNMDNLTDEMTPETFLKNGFIIEADACAAECVFAHQMMELGDKSIFKAHQKTPYAPMSTAFEREFAKSHDMDKARNAAFLAWFDLEVKKDYTGDYVDFIGEIAKDKQKSSFQDNFSAREMVKELCCNSNGQCYVENPEALEGPEKMVLSEKQAKQMIKKIEPYMQKFHRTPEQMGLDGIFVRHRDGSFTTAQEEMADMKKEREKAALRNAAKGKRGR